MAVKISPRFGHSGKVKYQYGHAFYHYRVVNGALYKFGCFTYWVDGRISISREKVWS